jgi:integrase
VGHEPDGERRAVQAVGDAAPPGHLPELRAAIGQLRADGRNPRLLVIDPLGACIGEGTILTSKGARRFKEMAGEAGLPVIKFHAARHTAATLALQAKVDSKIVSEQLGHSTTHQHLPAPRA